MTQAAITEQRPAIESIATSQELRRWYWLKTELVAHCKAIGIPIIGNKIEVTDQLATYLDTGQVPTEPMKRKTTSTFNWSKAALSLDTVITDNVSFGQNFRQFMTSIIGNRFVCHSDFMDWVRANPGKTLGEAADQ